MQGNKLKEQALLKVQSKIWEQKRLIKELEDDIEFEIVELQFNNAINQLQIYEYIKKAIQNYENT